MPLFKFYEDKKARICVIGDMMLDHYINGSCERISSEAPVVAKFGSAVATLDEIDNLNSNS